MAMKRWTTSEDLQLVASKTDEDMLSLFPDVKLGTLQRRRRLLRAQTGMSAGVTLGLMGLDTTHYDPKNFDAVIVGDLQSPFHDERALAAFNHMLATVLPDVLIDNGDHFDNYAISRYNKDLARAGADNFVKEVQTGTGIFAEWRNILGPERDIILHKGNHEIRWDTYVQSASLDKLVALAADKLTFESIYGLDDLGVITVPYMKPTVYGDVVISHGTTSSGNSGIVARNAIHKKYGRSVVLNHCHSAAMITQRYIDRTCVGIENFTLCDLDALGYAEYPSWVQGFTYLRVADGVTYLRPVMMVDQTFEFNGAIYTPEGVK